MKPATAPQNTDIEYALGAVEDALRQASEDLAAGEASALEHGSRRLQQLMLALSHAMACAAPASSAYSELRARLMRVTAGLGWLRENTARRGAAVQRSLKILLPSNATTPTYGRAAFASGQAGKVSAAFTSLRA